MEYTTDIKRDTLIIQALFKLSVAGYSDAEAKALPWEEAKLHKVTEEEYAALTTPFEVIVEEPIE